MWGLVKVIYQTPCCNRWMCKSPPPKKKKISNGLSVFQVTPRSLIRKDLISAEIMFDNTRRVWKVKETLLVSICALIVKSVTKGNGNAVSDFLNWYSSLQRRHFSELFPVIEKTSEQNGKEWFKTSYQTRHLKSVFWDHLSVIHSKRHFLGMRGVWTSQAG